jgi:hypothetical protein
LRAGNRNRVPGSRGVANAFELGAAKLVSLKYFRAAACALDASIVKRDCVLAGADKDFTRPFGHFLHRISFCSVTCPLLARADRRRNWPSTAMRQTAGRGTFMGYAVICKKMKK